MKTKITEEEYQLTIEKLRMIQEEEAVIPQLIKENQYLNTLKISTFTFPELIIILTRENNKMNLEIELLKKQFLANISCSEHIHLELKSKIEQLITLLYTLDSTDQLSTYDTTLLPYLMNYPSFKDFFDAIVERITCKKANTYTLEYASTCQKEKDHLLPIKIAYEHSNKPKRKILNKKKKANLQ